MKTLITSLFAILIICQVGFATTRTVSNSPSGGSQYSTLQAAYDASINGDTLLMEGTDNPYFLGCTEWNKSLTVIGIGFNPDKQLPKRTKIKETGCFGYIIMHASGSGSKFYGIEFTSTIHVNQAVTNYFFEDCRFNVVLSFNAVTTNFTFRNCIFDRNNDTNLIFGTSGTSATGTISNCVLDGYISGSNSVLANVTIDHCVFLGTTVTHFSQLHYALIRNNIFMNAFPGGTFNSTYTNNISRVAGTFPPTPANGNTASGNIENTDPQFVNVPVSTFYATTHDYKLQAGSPAIATASDGTDMGTHGGFTGFNERGEVKINPIVREVSIINTSVAPNGTLNVLIRATKPNDD